MKRFIFYILIIPQLALAHGVEQQIKSEYTSGKISFEEYLVNTALSIYAPEKLSSRYTVETTSRPQKSGTFIAALIKTHWDSLSPENQALLKTYIFRPTFPYNAVSPSGQFRVHYQMTGTNAVSPVDIDPDNGIPDYVDAVMESFDYSHNIETSYLGLNSPPTDNGEGGGNEFDIYIKNFSRIYGQTIFEASLPADETRYVSYIEIDNNYYGFPTSGRDGLRVTSAHEYFHAIQMGYRFTPDGPKFWEDEVFFYEISSTWMEDMVYDDINDYYYYLDNFFYSINKPFDTYDGSYEYGNCLWNHMLSKKYGAEIIVEIWEEIVDYPVLEAIDRTLMKHGSSFQNELIDYSIWNYFTGSRADTINYYEEGHYYDEVQVEVDQNFVSDFTLKSQSAQLAYSYYRFYDPETNMTTVLIPLNLEDNIGVQSDLTLDISRITSNLFTSITSNFKVRFVVDSRYDWYGHAITFFDDSQYTLSNFEAVQPDMIDMDGMVLSYGPNPLRPGIDDVFNVSYMIEDIEDVTIAIFMEDGSLVKKFELKSVASGINSFSWKTSELGEFPGGSGIYFLLIQTDQDKELIKFAVLR